MAIELITPEEFLQEYKHTKYPFTNASVLCTRDNKDIPCEFLLDANVYNYSDSTLSFTKIRVELYKIVLGFSTASRRDFITGEIDLTSSTENYVILSDEDNRNAGILLFDKDGLNEIASWPINEYAIPYGRIVFLPKCSRQFIENGLTGITIGDKTYTGDVCLMFGNGLIGGTYEPSYKYYNNLTVEERYSQSQTITIHCEGEPLTKSTAVEANELKTLTISGTGQKDGSYGTVSFDVHGSNVTINCISTPMYNAFNIAGNGNVLTIGLSGKVSG